MSFSGVIIFITNHADKFSFIGDYIKKVAASGSPDMLNQLIKVKTTKSGLFNNYTITLRVPKNKFEDDIYSEHMELLDVVPRAYTIITKGSGDAEELVSFVTGPRKFSGKNAADEDPENESYKNTGIYDHNKVLEWAEAGNLQIRSSEKANGKFALCRLFIHNGIMNLTFGSKNYHITIPLHLLHHWLGDEDNQTPDNAIAYAVAQDIYINRDDIIKLLPTFNEGYTLCGELCDGQHFVLGDNSIEWFGFFRFGECLDTTTTKTLLDDAGLKTVSSNIVFHAGDAIEKIDSIILAARCVDTEGAVLYFENIATGETILCKTKSVRYILMRMLRQAIINRGYMGIDHFIKRVIDASDYHGLHTDAAIRIAKELIRFVFWMMEHKIPTNVLGVIPVVSVRGKLPTGFAIWWNQYLITTGTPDLKISLSDFGDFNKVAFQASMDTFMKTGLRTNGAPCTIIFTQDLQGGGKSTTAAAIQGADHIGDTMNEGAYQFPINLVPHKFATGETSPSLLLTNLETEYVEQDMFYGHSPSCLSWIYYKVLYGTGPSTIIVSRCNANEEHYKKYVETLAPMPTMIYFIAPERVDYVSVITSMAGIIERSTNGDKLMVGRQEYSIEETLKIITNTFKDFKINDKAIRFSKFTGVDDIIADQAKTAFESNTIIEYVTANLEKILALRRPIVDIVADVTDIITRIQAGEFLDKVYHTPRPTYVGLCVSPCDADRLRVDTDITGYHYNHHTTQFFHGPGKRWKAAPFDTVPHGASVDVVVTHRVTHTSGAVAYRVDLRGVPCANPTPHITSFMPLGMKPAEANNFVGLTDDSVVVEAIDDMTIRLQSKWF